jgi:hypothetical protein
MSFSVRTLSHFECIGRFYLSIYSLYSKFHYSISWLISVHPRAPLFRLTIFLGVIVVICAAVLYGALMQGVTDLRVADVSSAEKIVTLDGKRMQLLALLKPALDLAARVTDQPALEKHLAVLPGAGLLVESSNFIEEPDTLASYDALNAFFDRQYRISKLLDGDEIAVAVRDVRTGAVAPLDVP